LRIYPMQILTDLSQVKPQPSCLTIGYFDGVHRGHRYLIGQASASARQRELRSVLLTFHPHPSVVLRGMEPSYLTTREEKLNLLSGMNLDLIVVQRFTPGLAKTRASQFVDRLITQVGMVELWVGPDFALGYRREGDIPFLRTMGDDRGYTVNVVSRLELDGAPISSSRIRRALREGDVTLAARCLGRPYCIRGSVTIGAQRGRTLGFPTANMEVPAERVVPANGVYAAWARLGAAQEMNSDPRLSADSAQIGEFPGKRHRAVINIGTRPTFDGGPHTIEAHLLDFNHNIYGQRLALEFVTRLRSEQRFNGVEALTAQIRRDVARARQLLYEK
jgi:riboflavin kinase/FMN adenylyltransferase